MDKSKALGICHNCKVLLPGCTIGDIESAKTDEIIKIPNCEKFFTFKSKNISQTTVDTETLNFSKNSEKTTNLTNPQEAEDVLGYKDASTSEMSADSTDSGRLAVLKTETEEQQSKEQSEKLNIQRELFPSFSVGKINTKNIKGKFAPKIYSFLENHPEEELTAKAIGFQLTILPNTVNHVLIRFLKENLIEEPHPGYYKYTQKIAPEELKLLVNLKTVELHKITLRIIRKKENGGVRRVKRNVKKCGDSRNPYTEEEFMIKSNCIKIWSYPRKLIISIACTDFPLDSYGFSNILAILDYEGLEVYNSEVIEWELNKDIPGLELYGCQCIKMNVFKNAFMRMYNKNSKLRIETNQKDLRINAEEALALVCANSQYNPAIMKGVFSENTEALNRVDRDINFMRNDKLKKKVKSKRTEFRK